MLVYKCTECAKEFNSVREYNNHLTTECIGSANKEHHEICLYRIDVSIEYSDSIDLLKVPLKFRYHKNGYFVFEDGFMVKDTDVDTEVSVFYSSKAISAIIYKNVSETSDEEAKKILEESINKKLACIKDTIEFFIKHQPIKNLDF